eukprot:3558399-Amphidinium_carterae.1
MVHKSFSHTSFRGPWLQHLQASALMHRRTSEIKPVKGTVGKAFELSAANGCGHPLQHFFKERCFVSWIQHSLNQTMQSLNNGS